MKTCTKCKIEKTVNEFHKDKKTKDGLRPHCKECLKQYREANKERKNEYNKQYNEANKEYIKEYQKQRKKTNPLFKLRCNISSLINKSMKNKGFTKRSRTFEILGCTYEEFKLHIESQFKKGMTWENAGQWHYDHIYPVSLAKNEEELIKLNHYTNFQPLWAEENLIKGNKIIEKQLKLL